MSPFMWFSFSPTTATRFIEISKLEKEAQFSISSYQFGSVSPFGMRV